MKIRLSCVLALLLVGGCASPSAPAGTLEEARPDVAGQWDEAWTQVPAPTDRPTDAALASAGDRFLAVGGRVDGRGPCRPEAYAWTGRWTRIAEPPQPVCDRVTAWTGTVALFISPGGRDPSFAYDPVSDGWHRIADPPRGLPGPATAWTGKDLYSWGSGWRNREPVGAFYRPAEDRWRSLPPAPVELNMADGVWTGRQFIVFGSRLDRGNHADTAVSVGAAYTPATHRWHEISPSRLSPQATAASWDGHALVAWDYETRSQTFDPRRDRWSERTRMPMDFSECYPDAIEVSKAVFGWFCGDAALWRDGEWVPVEGGPMDATVLAYSSPFPVYRFADMVASQDQVFLQMTGVVIDEGGTACYGCKGAPVSYWLFDPDEGPTPCAPPADLTPTVTTQEVRGRPVAIVSGAAPVGAEGAPTGAIELWVGLDPARWETARPGGSKSVPAEPWMKVRSYGRYALTGCGYEIGFQPTARAKPGLYPVTPILRVGRRLTPLPAVTVEFIEPAPRDSPSPEVD